MLQVMGLQKKFRIGKEQTRNKILEESKVNRERQGWFHAVEDVSFSCDSGQVLGLIGANGAGKTTSLRLLATSIRPDCGSIFLNNEDVGVNPMRMKAKIGFLSGSSGLYHRLTVRENIEYFGRLHGLRNDLLQEQIEKVFSLLDISYFSEKKPDVLSAGMKQRACIARSIIHNPSLLVLDEPTTGLDVISAETILSFIESYRERNVPIIFSTHHLHEVERLCDRVTLIDRGLSKFDGTLNEFRGIERSGDLKTTFINIVNAC